MQNVIEFFSSLWGITSLFIAAAAAWLVRYFFSFAAKLFGIERLENNARSFLDEKLLNRNRFSQWVLTPATQNELEYLANKLNNYLAPHERHDGASRFIKFWNVRSRDYLILRGPISGEHEDGNFGIAIIHPLKANYGKKFLSGTLVGSDLNPKMISTAPRSAYIYISFAEADDNKKRSILIEKIIQELSIISLRDVCIITRPTTIEALKLLSNRGFKSCKPHGAELEMRKTCFKKEYLGHAKSKLQ